MAKGKKKGGKRRGDDSDEEQPPPPKEEQQPTKGKIKKEKRLGKLKTKQRDNDSDDDDLPNIPTKNNYGSDSEEDDDAPPPHRGLSMLADNSSEEEDDDEPPQPVLTKKQLKKQREQEALAAAMAPSSSEEEEEAEEENEESETEQITFKILDIDDGKKKKKKDKKKKKEEDDDDGSKKKKKKDKKKKNDGEGEEKPKKKKDGECEEKPKKKDKKKKTEDSSVEDVAMEADTVEDVAVANVTHKVEHKLHLEEELDQLAHKPESKKSKFELQMEAALQKKHDEEEEKKKHNAEHEMDVKAAKKAEKEAKEQALKEAEIAKQMAAEAAVEEEKEDGDVFYGAPDEKVWSDKSHAQREAEEEANHGADLSLVYDQHGKKLSNKERKRLLKAREAAERQAEYEKTAEKASKEGAQFACSQTAVNDKDPHWENALDINIPNFSISAAGKILFKDAALTIGQGRRYGLVGPNGKGKSTLLKMIASRDLKIPPRIDFLYVEQEVEADDTPAVEAVLKADKKRWELLAEERELTKAVDAGNEDSETIDRLQQVLDELTQMGAASSEAKARRILFGLGFDGEMQTKPTKMFSGGWRMRISLARALFLEPTLLMLDEPTNHLDLNAVIWLDDYLQRWKKTLLIVSHDQDFLNSVCQEILHIEDLKLVSYKGDYDSFKKAEKVKFEQQVKAWEKQEKRLRELKRSGQSKAKATETVKNSAKREPGARSKKKQDDAIASGTAAAVNTELIKRPREYMVKLEFAEVAELSRPVMEVNRVHFRYSPKHPIIFDEVDFGIDMDSRICVVGPNGAGKSTLLKLLTGEVKATRGEVRRNPRLRMGIYNQHFVDRLPMNVTPIEHLRNRFQDEDYQSIRNRLGKYGLEGHAHEVVMRDLSGGQKARVVFVELSLQRPHILLLDEPTNNLDIETIDALVDAINEFNGGIVVVTHDQRLIEYCRCTLWVVEKRGVTKWEAGFDDYKETLLKEMEEQVEREAKERQTKIDAAAAARAEKMARLAKKVKK